MKAASHGVDRLPYQMLPEVGIEANGSLCRPGGVRFTNFLLGPIGQPIDHAAEKACRLNRPTLKLRRECAIRREICPIIPLPDHQARSGKPRGTWAFQRSGSGRRMFGWGPTGAAIATGDKHSLCDG